MFASKIRKNGQHPNLSQQQTLCIIREYLKRSHAVTDYIARKKERDSVKHDARKIFMMCNYNPSKECRQKKQVNLIKNVINNCNQNMIKGFEHLTGKSNLNSLNYKNGKTILYETFCY